MGAPSRDGLSSQAMEPQASPPEASIPSASFDAALALLPEGADWRRLTPRSISVYAASPYNAAAQTRYDGYGATIADQLLDALAKMRAAIEAKALAAKARGKTL